MNMRNTARGKASARERAATAWQPGTVVLLGHRSCGKTSLGELILQATRVTRQVGSVDARTSLLDWSEEEHKLGMTCALSTAWFEHAGAELVLIDTPGAPSLAHEQVRGLHVSDGAVLVVDAAQGVERGTEVAITRLAEGPWPTWVVVSKIERLVGELDDLVLGLDAAFAAGSTEGRRPPRVVPLHLPLWDADGSLQGLVDVLNEQILRYADDASGSFSPEPVPRALEPAVARARDLIAEAVALTDDELLEQYLEDLELSEADLEEGLARAVASGQAPPRAVGRLRCGSGYEHFARAFSCNSW